MSQIVSELKDLTYLSWALARQSSGMAGSFLKSYDDTGRSKVYYKLSDYRVGTGIVGHECVNPATCPSLRPRPLAAVALSHARGN